MALNVETIVTAAQRLLSRYGLPDVTMRRLAAELDVQPGALYYHVPNKQDLLLRVARSTLRPLEEQQGSSERIMIDLRRRVLPLRDGGDLLLVAYALDADLPPAPALRAALGRQGCSSEQAQCTAAALLRFALGSIAVDQNRELLAGADAEAGEGAYLFGLRRLLSGTQSNSS